MLLGILDLPREFHEISLCKIWGANRVHYGQLENTQYDRLRAMEDWLYCVNWVVGGRNNEVVILTGKS